MKKFFILITILLIFGVLITTPVFAEEINANEGNEEKIDYPCKVVGSLSDGGDVLFDITEGNVGDIVTAYVKADLFFSVTSVQINGTSVAINSDGKYQFELVDGENIFSVQFAIDNAKLEEVAGLIDNVKENGFSSLFTIENLLNLISWAFTLFLGSGFFITLIKSKKIKSKTIEQITEVIFNIMKTEQGKSLTNFLNTFGKEVLDKINLKIDNMDECMKVLCRCFVLAQNDTPENRLAIINELTNLSNSDKDLSEQIRNIIREEQKKQQQNIIERDRAIESLKENNESLTIKEDVDVNYGQL